MGERCSALDDCAEVVTEMAVVIENNRIGEDVHRMVAEVAQWDDRVAERWPLHRGEGVDASLRPFCVFGHHVGGGPLAAGPHRHLCVLLGVGGGAPLDARRIGNRVERRRHVLDDILNPPASAPTGGPPLLRRQRVEQSQCSRLFVAQRVDCCGRHQPRPTVDGEGTGTSKTYSSRIVWKRCPPPSLRPNITCSFAPVASARWSRRPV